MLKIGDFSQLAQVSVRALRIYDEMGLLKPVHVDRFSGYRYYEAEQLPRLNRIIALKDLGLTLDQMLRAFEEGSRLVKVCNTRLTEVERRIELLVKRDHKLEARPFEVEGRVPAEDSHEQDR